jgi:hypothetical protein
MLLYIYASFSFSGKQVLHYDTKWLSSPFFFLKDIFSYNVLDQKRITAVTSENIARDSNHRIVFVYT